MKDGIEEALEALARCVHMERRMFDWERDGPAKLNVTSARAVLEQLVERLNAENEDLVQRFCARGGELSALREELRAACDMRDGAMASCERLQHERDEARAQVESLRAGIECLVADEVISAGRARELHGLSVEEQRELWRRLANPEVPHQS